MMFNPIGVGVLLVFVHGFRSGTTVPSLHPWLFKLSPSGLGPLTYRACFPFKADAHFSLVFFADPACGTRLSPRVGSPREPLAFRRLSCSSNFCFWNF